MNIITPNDRAIIVPIDFSTTSHNALMHAADHAEIFGNDIVMVHVLEESYLSSLFGGSGSRTELMKTGIELKMNELKKEVLAKHPSLNIDFLIYEGKVYKALVEISEKMTCDS